MLHRRLRRLRRSGRESRLVWEERGAVRGAVRGGEIAWWRVMLKAGVVWCRGWLDGRRATQRCQDDDDDGDQNCENDIEAAGSVVEFTPYVC